MSEANISELFNSLFPPGTPFDTISKQLDTMTEHSHIHALREQLLSNMLDSIAVGYIKYSDKANFDTGALYLLFKENAAKLPRSNKYWRALYYFFSRQNDKCISLLTKDIDDILSRPDPVIDEAYIAYYYLIPFKQGFNGFWRAVADKLKQAHTDSKVFELCEMLEQYYAKFNDPAAVDLLCEFLQKYPDCSVAKELLGFEYYRMKMWNNAIAYFEQVGDRSNIFYQDDIYFRLAYAYDKVKNFAAAETYWRKAIELFPDGPYILNNLGNCLFRQRKYAEAEEIFKQCLAQNRDFPYSANNYVNLLIKTGRIKDAKALTADKRFKIAKSLTDKIQKLIVLETDASAADKAALADSYTDGYTETAAPDSALFAEEKLYQFSTEKLLEDELTAKIEAGIPVFGKTLKIYKRTGQYGRQYIIPVGRLDLLCEDRDGNIYIIELKKDSGYDDAYKQISMYLDWFEKNKPSGSKNIYGIICLNNPSPALIGKVHADRRIKLFEYHISYTEI